MVLHTDAGLRVYSASNDFFSLSHACDDTEKHVKS